MAPRSSYFPPKEEIMAPRSSELDQVRPQSVIPWRSNQPGAQRVALPEPGPAKRVNIQTVLIVNFG